MTLNIKPATKEWLIEYEKVKDLLKPEINLGELYTKKEAYGKRLFTIEIGEVNFPTGEILVRDPLVYLKKDSEPYFIKVPVGRFPLTILVVEVEEEHFRYASFRVKFNDKKAVSYREALLGTEKLDDIEEGDMFGFDVDAGLASIVDVKTRDLYAEFEEKWYENNPDGNIYDDFFAAEFKRNYEKNPEFQRTSGDWINFKIPESDLSVPMIQSGYGDGGYPVYFGFDENDEICEVIVEFIPFYMKDKDEE